MEEEFIISKGWEKVGWANGNIQYIHEKFNIEDDGFFVELKTWGKYVEIFEEHNHFGPQRIFRGYLKSNEDLEKIMELLEYDFK